MLPCREGICNRKAPKKIPNFFFFFFPDIRFLLVWGYRDTAKVPISLLAPQTLARPVLENAHQVHQLLPISHPCFRTRASLDVTRLQCYIHLNRVNRLRLRLLNRFYP